MALDVNNKNAYYLLGRYVAVVERSNNEPFTSGQLHNIQSNTANLMRYDRFKSKFMDVRQQILSNLSSDGWPEKVLEDADGSRFYVGYYHQKSALPMFTETIERHVPERVEAKSNNIIKSLQK